MIRVDLTAARLCPYGKAVEGVISNGDIEKKGCCLYVCISASVALKAVQNTAHCWSIQIPELAAKTINYLFFHR